jgi:hypothetical protein
MFILLGWGAAFDVSHRILFTQKAASGDLEHFVGLYHFPKSAVVAWPVKLIAVPGEASQSYFEPNLEVTEPCVIPIFSISPASVTACTFRWRSWLWQVTEYGGAVTGLCPRNRPFLDGKFRPLLEVCAEKSFFKMTKETLLKFAEHAGVEVHDG